MADTATPGGAGATVYRAQGVSRVSSIASRMLGRLRWWLWMVRRPALRRGSPVDVGAGAVITVASEAAEFRRGAHLVIRRDFTLALQGRLTVGSDVFIGRGVHITCFDRVTIGDRVRLAERVSIHDENHVIEPLTDLSRRANEYRVAPVTIGSGVWLGANVVVLPGVSIGDDTVVASGSVVTRSLRSGVVAAGAPAVPIRELQR